MGLITRLPFHPLLLAAYAVLFVYAANITEVTTADLLGPLLTALLGAAIVLGLCALLYRNARRGAVLATALIAAFAFFGHVASGLGEVVIQTPLQLALWVAFVVLAGTYAVLARASLPRVTATLNAFGLALVSITLITIIPSEAGRVVRASEGTPAETPVQTTATRLPDRDIYFLVFDRYGSDWSLKQRFGIENDIYPDLEAAGFEVVPGARANYHSSDFSLATMLNMSYQDDLAAGLEGPSIDRGPVEQRLAEHEVGRFLQSEGYRYYHLGAWWDPTRVSPIADQVLALGKTTEFDSVMRATTILPALEQLVSATKEDTPSRTQHREQALFAMRQVKRLALTPGRKFVFAHILMPHPPYVLGKNGRRVLKPEADEKSEAELYAQQLEFTNQRIREIVSTLLKGPDHKDPIIVITADEGPYMCYELDCVDGSPEVYGIRFGTLRAYYLPGLDYEVPSDDSGVNIFRMLFREYFGADLPDLPNRSFDWPDPDDLYEFRDITDELPLPGGREDG